jgi:threonine dehydratase
VIPSASVTIADLVSLEAIRAAAARIRGVARLTPLVDASDPAQPGTRRLFLKCENLQPGGAFKIRGAYNMIAQLAPEERAHGVITYSSGNHGQAVALAARLVGVPAVIVMPTTAPAIKVAGARSFGAEVVFEGTTSVERKQRADALAAERGLVMVPPFDHPWIIAGQGTAGLEIVAQCSGLETVYVQVGGGGLAAGLATAIKRLRPSVQVIGVEPAGAAKMKSSIEAGAPVTLDRTSSIADGLLPVRPGDLTFLHVRAFVDRLVTVEEDQIAAAVRWIFREAKIVVEPSGAVSVAAALADLPGLRSRETVAVLSGGNVETDAYVKILTGE